MVHDAVQSGALACNCRNCICGTAGANEHQRQHDDVDGERNHRKVYNPDDEFSDVIVELPPYQWGSLMKWLTATCRSIECLPYENFSHSDPTGSSTTR